MNETADAPNTAQTAASEQPAPAPQTPVAAPSSPTGGVFLQFIVFPLAIVLVAVTITGFFTWLAQDRRSYDEYLDEIQNGWEKGRAQSAYELSFRIADPADELRSTAKLDKTLAAFESARKRVASFTDPKDPKKADAQKVRRYLAVVLGHLGASRKPIDPRAKEPVDPSWDQAIDALVVALQDDDQETRLDATWALGRIRDPRAVPALVRMLDDPYDGQRKVACFALGELGDPERPDATIRDALYEKVGDQVIDVRWNATLALARLKDRRALPMLLTMLDRASLESSAAWTTSDGKNTVPMTKVERESAAVNVIVNAVRGVLALDAQEALPALDKLAAEDKSYTVRQAALEARDKLRRAEPPRR